MTVRTAFSTFLVLLGSISVTRAGDSNLKSDEIYSAWLRMYDLQFDQAHQELKRWQEAHPEDSLGPASDAAAYLFSELARLGSLEAELFVDDDRFKNRKKLDPDPKVRTSFNERIDLADRLADSALQKSDVDARALFVKTLTHGLRADYVALIDGRGIKALSYTKSGRVYAERLIVADPQAFDAYLGPGVENYLLSLKPIALRILLRLTGSQVDREAGLEKLGKTAAQGYYLEPFAKLLLAVAALRNNQPQKARGILTALHDRFPDNELYSVELNRLASMAQ
jgi:hypothetical protein